MLNLMIFRLCSPTRKSTRNVFFRPRLLNTFFITIPILVTIACFAFAILIADRVSTLMAAYDNFRLHFSVAAGVFDHLGNSTSAAIASKGTDFSGPAQAYDNLSLATIALLRILKYSSMNWIFAGLFLGPVSRTDVSPSVY